MVMKIILEAKKPLTLTQIIEEDKRLNYDRVRGSLTKASRKEFITRKMIRANGQRDRNIWYITQKGKDFVKRPKKTIII